MKKTIFKTLIIIWFVVSIIVTVVGILYLKNVNKEIISKATEIESILNDNDIKEKPVNFYNDDELDQTINEYNNGSAIALLTFKKDEKYKIAVYNGISKESLRMGACRAIGTANPNEIGNCVLFGHRDSAFRAIPHASVGDIISLQTKGSNIFYKIIKISIMEPEDARILERTDQKKLTLVTCYPFVFVGPAFQRCVVEATEIN